MAAHQAKGRWLDDGERTDPVRDECCSKQRDHAPVRVADQVGARLDQLRDRVRLRLEIDGLSGRVGRVAGPVRDDEPVVLCQRPLALPGLPARDDASVDQEKSRPAVAETLDVHEADCTCAATGG